MYLKYMLPAQIRDAVERNLPVLLPIGCVECHGHHLPVGCDTLIVEEVGRRLETRIDCVVVPTVDYGPTQYAVSGPDLGTMDMSFEELMPYARSVLAGLLALGFRRILVLVFHQGEMGELASTFRLVASRLITEKRWQECGHGWWGETRPASDSSFPSIAVRSVVHPKSSPPAGGDHAGINETSYMLSACPHAVDMSRLKPDGPWYTQVEGGRSADGSAERGERMLEAMVEAWAEELRPGQ